MAQPARIQARVAELIEHSEDLRTLVLAPERAAPRFRAGQFLHLAVDPYDPSSHWPESRIFSIASAPDERNRLRVTFSVVGSFTRRMLGLKVGDTVWVKLPYGDFFVETSATAPAVLVAGGTGVTPFVALLAQTTPPPGPIWLLYGARTPQLLIYREAISQATAACSQLKATFLAEHGTLPEVKSGRLSAEEALQAAAAMGGSETARFYLSGPPGMLAALKENLVGKGVDLSRIYIDAWGAL